MKWRLLNSELETMEWLKFLHVFDKKMINRDNRIKKVK